MSLADTLARMRREATPEGKPELFVHLLVGSYEGPNPLKEGLWAGFACDPTSSTGLHPPLFCRTTDPAVATCPACVAAGLTTGGAS